MTRIVFLLPLLQVSLALYSKRDVLSKRDLVVFLISERLLDR